MSKEHVIHILLKYHDDRLLSLDQIRLGLQEWDCRTTKGYISQILNRLKWQEGSAENPKNGLWRHKPTCVHD